MIVGIENIVEIDGGRGGCCERMRGRKGRWGSRMGWNRSCRQVVVVVVVVVEDNRRRKTQKRYYVDDHKKKKPTENVEDSSYSTKEDNPIEVVVDHIVEVEVAGRVIVVVVETGRR